MKIFKTKIDVINIINIITLTLTHSNIAITSQ
jgi:hypothetical protein